MKEIIVGAKNPNVIKMTPTAPSATLNHMRAPMPVMMAAEASTIAICTTPLPSS